MHHVSERFVNIFMYNLRLQTVFLNANRKKCALSSKNKYIFGVEDDSEGVIYIGAPHISVLFCGNNSE
jgi:hypothetical protein